MTWLYNLYLLLSNNAHIQCVILCFVERDSRYIRVMKTNLMHYLSSVYFVIQPFHISDMFIALHQEVYCIYTAIGTCCSWQQIRL